MSNPLEEIQKIYPALKLSPDGEKGELPLDKNGQWTLHAVKAENPENWRVHDAVTGEPFKMPSRGIPAAFRMIAHEFICTYKDIAPKLNKESIDALKDGGFVFEENAGIENVQMPAEYPVESFEDPENVPVAQGAAETHDKNTWPWCVDDETLIKQLNAVLLDTRGYKTLGVVHA